MNESKEKKTLHTPSENSDCVIVKFQLILNKNTSLFRKFRNLMKPHSPSNHSIFALGVVT